MTTESTTKKKRSAPKDALTRLREMRDVEARKLEKLRGVAADKRAEFEAAEVARDACLAVYNAYDAAVNARESCSAPVAVADTMPAPMVTGKAGRA